MPLAVNLLVAVQLRAQGHQDIGMNVHNTPPQSDVQTSPSLNGLHSKHQAELIVFRRLEGFGQDVSSHVICPNE